MPLVVLTGLPCSGKTRVAKAIREAAEAQGTWTRVVLVNEECLLQDRRIVYANARSEKEARSQVKAACERDVSRDVLVIADSVNFIKGFRYELFCIARAAATPLAVVFADVAPDTVRQWNTAAERYPTEILEDLIGRYEVPNPAQRWDRPCFFVNDTDDVPVVEILAALASQPTAGPNLSTRAPTVVDTDYLHQVDAATQQVVRALLDAQPGAVGQTVLVPGCAQGVSLVRPVTLPELRRLRRHFMKINEARPASSADVAAALFVQYLNAQLSS